MLLQCSCSAVISDGINSSGLLDTREYVIGGCLHFLFTTPTWLLPLSAYYHCLVTLLQWLTKLKLMDYSLLIGIHDCDRALVESENEQHADENGAHVSNY